MLDSTCLWRTGERRARNPKRCPLIGGASCSTPAVWGWLEVFGAESAFPRSLGGPRCHGNPRKRNGWVVLLVET